MNYLFLNKANATDIKTDCLILPVFSNGEQSDAFSAVNSSLDNQLTELFTNGDITGKQGSIEMLYEAPDVEAKRIMLVGCGKRKGFSSTVAGEVMKKVGTRLKGMKVATAMSLLTSGVLDDKDAVTQSVLAFDECFYDFSHYKSTAKAEDANRFETLTVVGVMAEGVGAHAVGVASGKQLAKDLANHPGNVCTPSYLAQTAKQLAEDYADLEVDILGEAEMDELGMGAFMSVSKGSREEGKMISMRYQGGESGARPVVLVGKGITFDTGGISLKPGANMDEMKFDMGGAASVFGTMKAIAAMGLPINVIGVVATAENMPSGHATKPGDIVTAMSGKTIEVLNTDAEGRLVLCDALTYVKKYDPAVVIDIATLTGACIIALGHHISGLISNDDTLADDILQAGKDCQDEAWRLPYNDKYKKQLKSEFADLGNIGGRAAGTITAGCFLSEFAEEYSWAHLDIAGTAWTGKAATGRPVPLLTQFVMNRCD
ncbi:MAG: Cytosol aminopeptidase PepA (EC [uncultured Thiotrichaceae bacterium]|uniref:Probable cytosol aminopeptidase n=1 Tax=uncultured Thiotrichaceae bacterium TaxID=298394 RepID=A0A6S6TPV4_9GAMM|nr:MAG: Cytosol aminopeptidase PepA (EC [uncultured Thiotrichaceae bacterium]